MIKILVTKPLAFLLAVLSVIFSVSCSETEERDDGDKARLGAIAYIDSLNHLSWELKGNYPVVAEQKCNLALQLAQAKGYTHGMAESYRTLGVINKNKGDFFIAFEMLTKSQANFEKLNDRKGMARVLNNLGNLLEGLEDFDGAIDYYQEGARICKEEMAHADDKKENMKLIGEINLNIGSIKLIQNKYAEAGELYTQSLEIFSQINDTSNLIAGYLNLGELCQKEGNFALAEQYYRRSKSLAENKQFSFYLLHVYHYLGQLSAIKDNREMAVHYLLQAEYLADSLKATLVTAEISEALGAIYLQIGDSGKAFTYLRKKEFIEEDLKPLETNKVIANLRLSKQKELDKLVIQNRTRLFYIALVGLCFSALLVIAIYRNFRTKKKANELLVEMDELKSRLFSDLTHEFRTPLTLILAPLEEMLSAGTKKNPSRSELKMMQRNAGHLLNLVNQMLDLAKLDAKSLKLDLMESDFVAFFKVRVLSFSSLASSKGIKFSYSVPGKPLNTLFDADKLEKIINNLLSNAIKFTGPGGEVKCVLEIVDKDKETIRFLVEDTGTGISADELGKIFDRYYQVEGSMRSGTFGTGIGLSLTRELVRLMHGEIRAESEPGCGSRFTVTMQLGKTHLDLNEYTILKRIMPPSARNEIAPEAVKKLPGKSDTVSGRKGERSDLPVVLIVEDQEDIRNYLAGHIGDNFRVLEAENGVKGLSAAIQHIPDLVITDLIMPGMDGLEMCGKLKEDEHTSHIPVIMLTAKTDLPDRMAGIGSGADAYLTKPFHIQEVLLVISKMIEQRKKLRERFSTNIKLEPKDIAITSADEKFLTRALAVIEDHLGDSAFDVSLFQKEMAMSRMQLFRKIKALTDQAPGDFIRIIRLKRAARLIEEGFGNIAQITYEVGFNNPSHFAKSFKDLYGILPSDYAKKYIPTNPQSSAF